MALRGGSRRTRSSRSAPRSPARPGLRPARPGRNRGRPGGCRARAASGGTSRPAAGRSSPPPSEPPASGSSRGAGAGTHGSGRPRRAAGRRTDTMVVSMSYQATDVGGGHRAGDDRLVHQTGDQVEYVVPRDTVTRADLLRCPPGRSRRRRPTTAPTASARPANTGHSSSRWLPPAPAAVAGAGLLAAGQQPEAVLEPVEDLRSDSVRIQTAASSRASGTPSNRRHTSIT